MEQAMRKRPRTANHWDDWMNATTPIAVPRIEDQKAREFSNASIGCGESEWRDLFRCPDAGNRKTQGIEDCHPVVFGHPCFPNRRQERLQLRKALRKEAGSPLLRARERQRSDGADVALGEEAHAGAPPFSGGAP